MVFSKNQSSTGHILVYDDFPSLLVRSFLLSASSKERSLLQLTNVKNVNSNFNLIMSNRKVFIEFSRINLDLKKRLAQLKCLQFFFSFGSEKREECSPCSTFFNFVFRSDFIFLSSISLNYIQIKMSCMC